MEKLEKGFEEYKMSPIAVYGEDSSPVIRFKGANDSDCSLSVVVSDGWVVVYRVIGTGTIAQDFHYKDIDNDFFKLVRDHYDTIRSLIKMRDGLLGKI